MSSYRTNLLHLERPSTSPGKSCSGRGKQRAATFARPQVSRSAGRDGPTSVDETVSVEEECDAALLVKKWSKTDERIRLEILHAFYTKSSQEKVHHDHRASDRKGSGHGHLGAERSRPAEHHALSCPQDSHLSGSTEALKTAQEGKCCTHTFTTFYLPTQEMCLMWYAFVCKASDNCVGFIS